MDEATLNVSPAGHGQLVKMLTELFNHMVYLDIFCILIHFNIVEQMVCKTRMTSSPSISHAGRDLLVKMLKRHGIFFFIYTL